MPSYMVTWRIDIEADNPDDAAFEARRIQRKPDSIATVFEIKDQATDRTVTVDLSPQHAS